MDGGNGKQNPHHGCGADPDHQQLCALTGGEGGYGHRDDDGVVTCKNEIDQNDLEKSRKLSGPGHT
jgi:hypothetical protein